MKFVMTAIRGVYVVEIERLEDERGYFARTWCREDFRRGGIDANIVQASISHNRTARTLRGLHYSRAPSTEAKLVTCTRGRVFDIVVDLRPDSPTYCRHTSVELDAEEHNAMFVPWGCAHGFQTLTDDCDVLYMMTDIFRPELAAGVRFDDPAFAIAWPHPPAVIAERDRTYPIFDAGSDPLAPAVSAAY